ncbi:lysylphosphatidylglycerol synthase transmembrane domain-containing protein [Roseiflexus castenholzii]|uniref:lysylphosphatidylglycerol synthase transmembrane domain-containing protein n=1 Tax=Roseiflexus castenholzii TaxID=120962 RepID=UPI0023569082
MKHWSHWIRVGLGIALIVLLVVQFADTRSVWKTIVAAHPLPLAGSIVIYFVGVMLSCLKWRLLLRAQGIRAPLTRLVQWYLMGALAGTLLPSDIGGDLGRGYAAARAIGNQAGVWISVVMERLTGLLTLVAMASLALALIPDVLDALVWLPIGAGLGMALTAIGFAALSGFLPLRLAHAPHWMEPIIAQLQDVITPYRNNLRTIVACLGLSAMFHAGNALSFWLLAVSVKPDAPVATIILWPLVGVFGLLPLTPGGLGVREGVTAVLLMRVGLTPDQAVAAAMIARILLLLCSLTGLPTLVATISSVDKRISTISKKEMPDDAQA